MVQPRAVPRAGGGNTARDRVLLKNDSRRDYEGQAEAAFQALARFPSLRPTGDLDDPVARPSDRTCRPHFCTTSRRHAPQERTPGAAETVA